MVFAPYIKIATAETLKFRDGTSVRTPAEYVGWHRECLEDRGSIASAWMYAKPAPARINHGRWLADCPHCNGAALTHPSWRLAGCSECGCLMVNVQFPNNYSAIEAALLRRPIRSTQNWTITENLTDIVRENHEQLGDA